METPLLKDIVVIFSLSVAVLLVCHRLKIPAIVGFLFTGILAGPHGLGLVAHVEDVSTLSEIGIVFLLFSVGMEFSFDRLKEVKRYFFIGGGIQVSLTILGGLFAGWVLGRPLREALFLGFLLSLSSTAITLRILDQRGERNTLFGNLVVGILIFQDIIAIPMLLFTPLLAGGGEAVDITFLGTLATGLAMLALVFFTAEFLVPKILFFITRTRNRELFLLGVLTIGFMVGYLTASLGFSIALGAFLAGLIISKSEYTTEAIHDILPFQEVFLSLFFVATGMLLDVSFLFNNLLIVLGTTVGIVCLKFFTTLVASLTLRMSLRVSIITALALAQIGEFSFVLAKLGIGLNFANPFLYQLFLSVSLLTMALTPIFIEFAPKIADALCSLPGMQRLRENLYPAKSREKGIFLENHLIIVGFGWCGRRLYSIAKQREIPSLIIEMNAETVTKERSLGKTILYGDASHEFVLKAAQIETAKVCAIVINDPVATQRIAKVLKHLKPDLKIVARAHYFSHMTFLKGVGVDEVVCDELCASKEIMVQSLKHLGISEDVADAMIAKEIEQTVGPVLI